MPGVDSFAETLDDRQRVSELFGFWPGALGYTGHRNFPDAVHRDLTRAMNISYIWGYYPS